MPAPLIAALLIASAYAGLIAAHARLIRRSRRRGAFEPRAALWLASRFGALPEPGDAAGTAPSDGHGTAGGMVLGAGSATEPGDADGLARAETEAIERLLRGELEPAAYRAAMADVAARAAAR